MSVDLHRHDEFSAFDGFGKAKQLVAIARKRGITALGIANHGNMNGVVEHWKACLDGGIKPILGVEAYFQPKFNKENPKRQSFHMCLFALNLEGYKNLNRITTISNQEQRYYKPICDYDLLEKYSEGVIATSGCIASFISQMIVKDRMDMAYKATEKFISIFGRDNFYIELQPYKLDERTPEEKNLQERVNVKLVHIAKKYKLKMVLTSDAHYGSEKDYDTYMKMHEIKGSGEYNDTYAERYMPYECDLENRFIEMHSKDFGEVAATKIAKKAMAGLKDIEERVEMDILGQLQIELPKLGKDTKQLLKERVKEGLQRKGKWNKKYAKRVMEEYDVITHHGFEDYFLIVQDYVNYAKRNFDAVDKATETLWKKFITEHNYPKQPIAVGPGRGSVCNSLLAYALDITEVDSLYFDIPFDRFMRKDKKKMPDIDLDFETDRRQEVIEYIVWRYPGQAAQICSYGTYQIDNLLNDLFKVCGLDNKENSPDVERLSKTMVEDERMRIKKYVREHVVDGEFMYKDIYRTSECVMYNKMYDNIIKHFYKMYKKVRYIGTHAAGVAVVGGELTDYASIELRGNAKSGYTRTTSYDLDNLESINVIKFDILGLRTLSITKELEQETNECFCYEWLEDNEVYDYFAEGKTDGVFQFEKDVAKKIFRMIQADSIDDVIAVNALNRPGPLSMKMHELYAHNKLEDVEEQAWSKYTSTTHGTVIFQEQATTIAREIGGLDYEQTDRILKIIKSESNLDEFKDEIDELRKVFVKGAMRKSGLSKDDATMLFNLMVVYSFNKGHATGYGMIAFKQMWYKVHFPEAFWHITLKYATKDDAFRLKAQAVYEGNVILNAHVNYEKSFSIRKIDGENALAEGVSSIKGVGPKAADAIVNERKENGPYKSKDDFLERVDKRVVNVGVVRALEDAGALIFNKKKYFARVKQTNTHLYTMGLQQNTKVVS